MTNVVRWPGGKESPKFISWVRRHKSKILTGKLLAVDPASGKSSCPGYAVYEKGQLLESGVIDIPQGDTTERLANLHECMAREFKGIDVLVIEKLRGRMVHTTLTWAAGVTVAAINAPVLVECPISFWKALAVTRKAYVKADDADAELMGDTVIMLAREAA